MIKYLLIKEPIVITGRKNESGLTLGSCFSSNSKTVVTGNEDNEVLMFDKLSGELLTTLSGHVTPVGCAR